MQPPLSLFHLFPIPLVMPTSLLFIPTDRWCGRAIVNYVREAVAIARAGTECVLAVVESNNRLHSTRHANLLSKLRDQNRIRLIHWTTDAQRRFLRQLGIVANLAPAQFAWLERLLMPNVPNYSSGPNKAALLASSLNADMVLRRDSDTQPLRHNGHHLYPSEIEIDLLDRPVSHRYERITGIASIPDRYPVQCVATGYIGTPSIDRTDLARVAEDLLIENEAIQNPRADAAQLLRRAQTRVATSSPFHFTSDSIRLDAHGDGEMGACGIGSIFRLTPELPLDCTLGTDYFIRNLCFRVGIPVIFHNRRVLHRHNTRTAKHVDTGVYVDYAMKDFRFKLMKRICTHLNERLESSGDLGVVTHPAFWFDSRAYAHQIRLAARSVSLTELHQVTEHTISLYTKAGSHATVRADLDADWYFSAAREIDAMSEAAIATVRIAFLDFASLVELWPKLIDCAGEVDLQEVG